MEPVTITALIGAAAKSYNMVRKAMEMGREASDMVEYFSAFYDKKDQLDVRKIQNENGSKLFRGKSVEAEALELQMAEHKMQKMESELRELICWTVGNDFYLDMMRKRNQIRQRRLEQAKARAVRNKLFIDGGIVVGLFVSLIGVIIFGVNLARG
jgi:hypothetical protein